MIAIESMLLMLLLQPAAEPAKPAETDQVRVAGIVLKWIPKSKQQNYQRTQALIRKAAGQGAKIVCTTECSLDGYSIRDKAMPWREFWDLGEPIPGGEYIGKYQMLAKELRIHLIAGMLEKDGLLLHNTAVLIGPDGEIIGKYRKNHLGHELARVTPGGKYPVFETPYGRVGLMICADRRFPKTMSRLKAAGAELVFCPSGGMWGPKNNDFYLQDRSQEGNVPIVFVHPIEFLVTGRTGKILSREFYGDNMDERSTTNKPKQGGVIRIYDLPLPKGKRYCEVPDESQSDNNCQAQLYGFPCPKSKVQCPNSALRIPPSSSFPQKVPDVSQATGITEYSGFTGR